MGSEGVSMTSPPSTIKFHLTGFKKFDNVAENPTELLVGKVQEFVQGARALPSGITIESCTVLETAGAGAQAFLLDLLNSSCADSFETEAAVSGASHIQHPESNGAPKIQVVWVHFGVKGGASGFEVEHQAVNEATFRCPDEMGWQPNGEPIVEEDGGISHIRQTDLPVEKVVATLVQQLFDVWASRDAGRFVCNYVYYLSLRHAASHGHRSLFVHVPPFSVKDLHSQLEFVAALLKVLASCCSASSSSPQ